MRRSVARQLTRLTGCRKSSSASIILIWRHVSSELHKEAGCSVPQCLPMLSNVFVSMCAVHCPYMPLLNSSLLNCLRTTSFSFQWEVPPMVLVHWIFKGWEPVGCTWWSCWDVNCSRLFWTVMTQLWPKNQSDLDTTQVTVNLHLQQRSSNQDTSLVVLPAAGIAAHAPGPTARNQAVDLTPLGLMVHLQLF